MISIGYNFGDWLIKKRILKLVKFYSPQQEKLEVILDDFMTWHRANALETYRLDLLKIRTRLEGGKLKPLQAKELTSLIDHFRSRYFESFNRLNTQVLPLLANLTDEQVERSKVLLGRKLDEKKLRSKRSKQELRDELERKWLETLEEWFGSLSKEQVKLITKLAPTTFIDPLIVWSRAGKITNNFINTFDEKDIKERKIALKKFFSDWREDDFYSSWRRDVGAVLAQFLETTDEKQRKHILAKLDEIIGVIKSLQD